MWLDFSGKRSADVLLAPLIGPRFLEPLDLALCLSDAGEDFCCCRSLFPVLFYVTRRRPEGGQQGLK